MNYCLQQLFLAGKRGADGRLSSAQTALMLQEETIRRLERERKVLNDKLLTLEASIAQAEADKRVFREKLGKSQKAETRSEKERDAMRQQIDNAESRVTRMELKKKSLEGKTLLNGTVISQALMKYAQTLLD